MHIWFPRATVLFGLMMVLGASPVFSQSTATDPSATTATYGNWTLRCVKIPGEGKAAATSCEVVQTVQMQGQSQPVAQVAIGRLPNDKTLIMTAVVPVNISLPGQIHLSGNGKSGSEEKGGVTLSLTRCLGGGCFAEARPDDATLKVLRNGTDGELRFADAGRRMVALPLSWQGLDQALKALDKAQ